jgi:hypothetical protein
MARGARPVTVSDRFEARQQAIFGFDVRSDANLLTLRNGKLKLSRPVRHPQGRTRT